MNRVQPDSLQSLNTHQKEISRKSIKQHRPVKPAAQWFQAVRVCKGARGASSSSSAFDMMVALTRFFLPWVPHIWMSGTNLLQTPRAWFWGTHKWAIFAAWLADGVSRTVGKVLVFGPPLHRGIVRRSLRQSSWDGYSVCSGLFWGERWWSVGDVPADGALPVLGCILQSCSGRWLSF